MGESSRIEVHGFDVAVSKDVDWLRGDRQIQLDVLVALAECRNHRKWFEGFARPYLGEHPIEIGSGLGDYAVEWFPAVEKYTATEADPVLLAALKRTMARYPGITVRQLVLPSEERAEHSCLVSYNVLEYIEDHIGALQSMARLVRPEGYIILVSAAFPFAMSPVDIATGQVRRYTKGMMRKALTDAGLEVVEVRYANSLGLICYYAFASLLKKEPSTGGTITFYDRLVVPVTRVIERALGDRPPFGQSVVAVARVHELDDEATSAHNSSESIEPSTNPPPPEQQPLWWAFYDRLVAPTTRLLKRVVRRISFGQSVVAVACVHELDDEATSAHNSSESIEPSTNPPPPEQQPLWRAFTDGLGGVFDIFGGIQRTRQGPPTFEATLADDAHSLCHALGLIPRDGNGHKEAQH
jgi:Methyltransferase domain